MVLYVSAMLINTQYCTVVCTSTLYHADTYSTVF